jgi:hypothetical protein
MPCSFDPFLLAAMENIRSMRSETRSRVKTIAVPSSDDVPPAAVATKGQKVSEKQDGRNRWQGTISALSLFHLQESYFYVGY